MSYANERNIDKNKGPYFLGDWFRETSAMSGENGETLDNLTSEQSDQSLQIPRKIYIDFQ